MLDGKPWFPVMGEFHYSRYPGRGLGRRDPQDEGRRRANRFHLHLLDPPRGSRRAIRLVGTPRPAPLRGAVPASTACTSGCAWARGTTARSAMAGCPTGCCEKTKTRENDPQYLKYVERFYRRNRAPTRRPVLEGRRSHRRRADRERIPSARTGKGRGAHPGAAEDGARGRHGRAVLFDDRMGRCGDSGEGRDPGIRRVSRRILVSPAGAAAAESDVFLLAHPAGRERGRRLCSKRPDIDARVAPYPFFTAEMARRNGAGLPSPAR